MDGLEFDAVVTDFLPFVIKDTFYHSSAHLEGEFYVPSECPKAAQAHTPIRV